MNRTKYLAKNTIIFAIGNLGSKLINFFLVPLFTNALTTQEYGITDLIFTICSIAVPIIFFNVNEAVMRYSIDEDADLNKIMSVGILVSLLSFMIAIPLFGVSWIYPILLQYHKYIYIYTIAHGICEINISYLRGKECLKAFAIGSILRTFLIAVFNILFLVVFQYGIEGYLMAFILSNILTGIYAFVAGNVIDVLKHYSFDKELFKRMVRYSLPIIPNSFMWWIIDSSNRIMITSMISVSASGIYAVASKIAGLVSFISTIFNQAYSYSAIHENNSEDREDFNNKIMDMLFLLITVIGLFVLTIIKPFMKIYVGSQFVEAWIYAPPLIIGTCILVMATFFSVFYKVNKDSNGFLKSGILGAIINIILNFSLIPIWGVIGAAISTCITYVAIFIFRYFDTKKYIQLEVFNLRHIISFLILISAGIAVYISVIIQIIVFAVSLLFICILYKNCIQLFVIKSLGLITSFFKK
ncbi:MAG: oligosaccharide flippase family protein [Lachnospiraceae bacterium]|nr:oligosaccharide flippase family protein [Lachnospiraceae bacterium]